MSHAVNTEDVQAITRPMAAVDRRKAVDTLAWRCDWDSPHYEDELMERRFFGRAAGSFVNEDRWREARFVVDQLFGEESMDGARRTPFIREMGSLDQHRDRGRPESTWDPEQWTYEIHRDCSFESCHVVATLQTDPEADGPSMEDALAMAAAPELIVDLMCEVLRLRSLLQQARRSI